MYEWLTLLRVGVPCLPVIPLGTYYKGKYHFSDECFDRLEEIYCCLRSEESDTHPIRRVLGFIDIIKQDLVPILMETENQPNIFQTTVKLLVWLTLPTESLVTVGTSREGQKNTTSRVVHELNHFICNSKEAFLDFRAARAIIDYLNQLLERQPLSSEDCELMNHSLLLIRNILHIPERFHNTPSTAPPSLNETILCPVDQHLTNRNVIYSPQQNILLMNLFTHGIDRLLISLLNSSQKDEWGIAIVQLLPLFYKDQHIDKMQKLVAHSFRHERKFSSEKRIVIEGDVPTDDIISQLLKKFTLIFLVEGYDQLIDQIYEQLLQQDTIPFDHSHFLWLIAYFTRFIPLLGLKIHHFENVFNIKLLCFLIWELVHESEKFEINSMQPSTIDLESNIRRLHLTVTAISELLQALEFYSQKNLRENESNQRSLEQSQVDQLRWCLLNIRDFPHLFLFALRLFNSTLHSRRYLLDLISANHILLLTFERASQLLDYRASFDLHQHLKHYCSPEILARYATALVDFQTNGSYVNDCIFTMFYHIAIDLKRVDLLFDPKILDSFNKILEQGFNVKICILEIGDDWIDLIYLVVKKFLRRFETGNLNSHSKKSFESNDDEKDDPELKLQSSFPTNAESLRDWLLNSGFEKHLKWIQSCLLVSCSARLPMDADKMFRNPIIYLSLKMNVSCPIVPWTSSEALAFRSEQFLLLLDRIGLLSHDGLYPRIPNDWSADTVYSVASFLGSVDQQLFDADKCGVKQINLPFLALSPD